MEGTYPCLIRKAVELNLKLDYRRAAGLIVPSLPRCQIINRQYQVPLPKIHLILNGTDELDWGMLPTKARGQAALRAARRFFLPGVSGRHL